GLAEIDMCLPYTLEQLKNLVNELNFKNTKLESMQQALKQSEKLAHLGQLSAGIAHELNNPLGVVIMYANILLDELDEQNPYYNDIKLIGEQAERCKKIVGGLLNFARKNKVAFANVDIHEFIQSCVRSVVIPENINVKIKNFLTIHDFNIDKEQMTQAITNIIKNAVEAMPDGGDLSIVLSNNNNEVEIKISDTGTGIAPEHMDKLFTPFFTTKPLGKGTGLGLPTTYGIVKMHKGRIDIESNYDKTKGPTGTSFIVKLPLNKNLEQ
ncbi:MAG: HAMP domain-containing sensor histidine kinase, partial [Bacteroidales bacterium]